MQQETTKKFQKVLLWINLANQQRMQQGAAFGQLGQLTSGIGGTMAGLGGQAQQLAQSDVNQLMGIGGMQQQLAQLGLNTDTANLAAMQNAPFQQLSAGAGILGQLLPGGAGTQVVAPFAQTNPYAQAFGAIGSLTNPGQGGLSSLIG